MFEYIKNYYGVPAEVGRIVEVNGKSGIIAEDRGNYIGVNFDEDKPMYISYCHPTYKVKYLGMGKVRVLTRSQQRYKRYIEYSDMFESFIDFCRWDAEPERSWNN